MRARLNSKGFSLIELMISVSIIGIIAITAVPSFNKYMYRAKAVEAYSSISAIQKAEIQHYLNYGRFVIADLNTNLTSGSGKQQLSSVGASEAEWDKLGWPLPFNSYNYFGYKAVGGYTDAAGDPFRVYWDTSDPPELLDTPFNWDGANIPIFLSLSPVTQCDFSWSDADLGINQNSGEDWVVIFAGANFEEEPDHVCTMYLQVVNRTDGAFTMTPIIAMNEGQ